MRFTPEDISLIVGLVSAMLAIYGRFKSEIMMQEKRMTILEKDNEFLKEFKTMVCLKTQLGIRRYSVCLDRKSS